MELKAIWTYETIDKKSNFCKAEIYAIAASVLLWKHFNPTHKTKFYCDKKSLEYFENKGILKCFDEIDSYTLEQPISINKDVFWANSKIRAIANEKAPLVHIDLDLFCYEDIVAKGFLKNDIAVSHIENPNGFYLDYKTALLGIDKTFAEQTKVAYNTSILFIKEDWFKTKYCNTALSYMQLASTTNLQPIHSKNASLYMTFAEQKLLADLAIQEQIKVGTIVKNIMDCGTGNFTDVIYENGLDKLEQTEEYMVHFGSFKKELKQSRKLQKRVIEHIKILFKKNGIKYQFKIGLGCAIKSMLSISLFK